MSRRSGSIAISAIAGAKNSCSASTAPLSAPQYDAAAVIATSANGICAFPLPVRSA